MGMLGSLALLLVVGFVAGKIMEAFHLPGLVGMLMAGIVLGPYGLALLDSDLLHISLELRALALILILLRAGLGLNRSELTKVGRAAIRLSAIPCLFEGTVVMIVSRWILNFSWAEAGTLGFILAAVSPAVVVPEMLALQEEGYGTNKQIPTLILGGAAVDDVFAITLFGVFLNLAVDNTVNPVRALAHIPWSICAGILGGLVIGAVLLRLFDFKKLETRNTEKLLLTLAAAMLFYEFGQAHEIASLLGVMAMGFVILEKRESSAQQFSAKLARVWVFAQVILFALVGAEVNIHVAIKGGLLGLAVILIGLVGRSIGVWVATMGTELNHKERVFCMIAYLPKATVQAAIGGLPLASGMESGGLILA
ncbi:MAG: sodium:proton antiporter, partial [Firmicutes bacterium]|nr:sodium:proton antiporter [Bacillota bacterium]